jgi:hypothetical protein
MANEISVKVIEHRPNWVLVEFEAPLEGGVPGKLYLQRKLIPWAVCPAMKGRATRISPDVLSMGMEYSDVDLVASLGETLPVIRVCDIQDALRRVGLWTQADYKQHPQKIRGVLQRLLSVDVASIANAAHRGPQESD